MWNFKAKYKSTHQSLDTWLEISTRGLAPESIERVREEIMGHHQLSFDESVSREATDDDAQRAAVLALGDPRAANRGYRRELLTAADMKQLKALNRFSSPFSRVFVIVLAALSFYFYGWVLFFSFGPSFEPFWPESFRTFFIILVIFSIGICYLFLAIPGRHYYGRIYFRLLSYLCWICLLVMFGFLDAGLQSAHPYVVMIAFISSLIFIIRGFWLTSKLRRKLPKQDWPDGLC